jgi:hypothetical protein
MTPFTTEDRKAGYKGMRDSMTPATRVRRRFLQGRTAKRDVLHTPLAAISTAVESLADVLRYIESKEPTLSPDNVRVSVVCLSNGTVYTREVHSDPKHIHALFDEFTALPAFVCIGLTFLIQEIVDGNSYAGGWIKPFVWSDDTVAILGGVLEKLLKRFGKGEKEMQTPEVTKFLADAKAWPWETFHLVTLDGSFFPATTDVEVLNAAVQRLGCAGFIGYVHKKSTNELVQMIRPYGVETPEATEALNSAADGLRADAVVCNEDPSTGEFSN